MIKDFSVTPKPQNKNAKILMCAFFVIALISVMIAIFIDRYKGVVGMITLLSLTTAILVYTKYVSVTFHYDILAEGLDEPLFVVRQTVGKRNVTLCRIALASISKIEKESAKERRAHKTGVGVSRYVYTPTLSPSVSYRIFVSSRYEKAEIIVEISEEFAEMLIAIAQEARALSSLEEDS